MSEDTRKPQGLKETERIAQPGPSHGPGGAMVAQKAESFRESGKRLVGLLRPDRATALLVVAFGALSVLMTATGPRILGHATDLVFTGVLGAASRQGPRTPSCPRPSRARVSCPARASTSARSARCC